MSKPTFHPAEAYEPPPSTFFRTKEHIGHLLAFIAHHLLVRGYDANGRFDNPTNMVQPTETHCIDCGMLWAGDRAAEITNVRLVRQLSMQPDLNIAGRLIVDVSSAGSPVELDTELSAIDQEMLDEYFEEASDEL